MRDPDPFDRPWQRPRGDPGGDLQALPGDGDAAPERPPSYSGVFRQYRAEPPPAPPPEPPERRGPRWTLPLALFVATCASTFIVGGLAYAVPLMVILLAHEFGHFFQARRYGVPASLPYFIPMPLTPIGTMGAIIGMRPHAAHRRALFDLAITGPIAGLIPSLAASYAGLRLSTVGVIEEDGYFLRLGEPLVFKLLSQLTLGPLPEGHEVTLHPIAYAGWVGIFITALNLLPIGQLDGGHILYTLVPRHAFPVSLGLLASAAVAVVAGGYWQWTLMILLLALIGVRHPPTANEVRLDPGRRLLGWLMLTFVFFGFTPTPFIL